RARGGRDRRRAHQAAPSVYPRAAGGDAARRPAGRSAAPGAAGIDRKSVGRGAPARPAIRGGRVMTDILLRTGSLSFAYPQRGRLFRRASPRDVVKRVDLAVPRGSVLGLVGESGSGKTTL